MTRTDYFNDPNAPAANSIGVAVSAFTLNERGELLMIRRTDNDLYALPGGNLELGETLSEAAVREVREETGIEVEVTELIGAYSNPRHVIAYDDGEVRQEFSICFRATPTGGDLRTSSESKEVYWVPRDAIGDLNVHPSIRLRIQHGFENRQSAFFT
ncbi:ADP-ribose pyrophosphatase YjhB (NUDIX family) [Amycolatopsis bartoniae]|uniref:NUDIX hydrolase n=1 Tax=Amycolatopsis bartoniae TaxID=941986 RepID=A0A8H9MDA3_9PSEU|nr:NUDIX domain-containing protein [Amycolatopsis bartoniae]MBB2935672.1 ADP-ribose pyrophosphatase YjhB (NUDIX family) [Amycolatopsis bartoniae]TVT02316.1 NUDIX domain-containing protein [Amycolatopsis bartoniae]GHF61020.1 NUDIX hydrolase [Amycolatopsis bartoniae]